jgi:hypothetical protein
MISIQLNQEIENSYSTKQNLLSAFLHTKELMNLRDIKTKTKNASYQNKRYKGKYSAFY